MSYVVKKNITEWGHDNGVRVSAEVFDGLSDMVDSILDKAKERAEGNGRSTIKLRDL
ncbi:hypothetical protein GQ472_00665 [archaeon]|nr:hypothetical protein [archaeon]